MSDSGVESDQCSVSRDASQIPGGVLQGLANAAAGEMVSRDASQRSGGYPRI